MVAAFACAGNGVGLDEQGNPIDTANQTSDSISFATRVQPIFTANCAFAGCHAGTSPQQGMNLSAGLAHQNIVNVPANERAGMMRVKPFEPDSSYLVHKIQGTQGTVGGSGGQMPLGGTPLSAQQISLIRAWITQGAKNN
ncbi:MAG: hypothetical protein HYW52_06765 [Gemmatimonadetes bacterium]|nr:hypothetical protein [Gemmatimonadota bacterium]